MRKNRLRNCRISIVQWSDLTVLRRYALYSGLVLGMLLYTWFETFLAYGSTRSSTLKIGEPLLVSVSCRLLGLLQQTQPAGPGGAGDRYPVLRPPLHHPRAGKRPAQEQEQAARSGPFNRFDSFVQSGDGGERRPGCNTREKQA